MQIIIKTPPGEVERAKKWWNGLEAQWKMAYNEAVYGKGPTLEPPHEDELMLLLIQVDTLRFAGPLAPHPNLSFALTNLSGLIPLYRLTYLSVSNTLVESLEPLRRHTNLEHLFVYDNRLGSLAGIEGMKGLKDLYCQNNRITSLGPISGLYQLENLYVSGNPLEKVDGLGVKHKAQLKNFYLLPSPALPDEEVIRVEHTLGIRCLKG